MIKSTNQQSGSPLNGNGQSLVNIMNFVDNSMNFKLQYLNKYDSFIKMNNQMTVDELKNYTSVDHAKIKQTSSIKILQANEREILPKLHRNIVYVPFNWLQAGLPQNNPNFIFKDAMVDYQAYPEAMESKELFSNKV